MSFTYRPFLFFYLFSTLAIAGCIIFFNDLSMNFYSVCIQFLGMILTGLFFRKLPNIVARESGRGFERKFSVFYLLNKADNKEAKNLVFSILGATLVLGFINAWLIIFWKTDIDANQRSLLSTIFFSTLGITQFGGWFFQTVLIYMVSVVLGAKKPFGFYLRIMGISYVGFMFLAAFTLLLNYYYIPDHVTLQDFNNLIRSSPVYIIAGKSGEFLVLAMVGAAIANYENFTPLKALLIGCIPSIMLLVFNGLFDKIL
ncbi:hypothetical protein [Pedobacter jamesrossensis]|uniref:Uncharacterized protein n=1 Tax=Pedobacter jamesrossensis TaxID=1908238 RepID=A0ABV8NM10_9SPHI